MDFLKYDIIILEEWQCRGKGVRELKSLCTTIESQQQQNPSVRIKK